MFGKKNADESAQANKPQHRNDVQTICAMQRKIDMLVYDLKCLHALLTEEQPPHIIKMDNENELFYEIYDLVHKLKERRNL